MKIERTTTWSGMVAVTVAALLALAFASPAAQAASVDVTAETIQVVEAGGFADAEFTITVTNGESVPASNVSVVFADGLEVSFGNVAAGGSAQSAPQTRSIDTVEMPTRFSPVPVTLMFTLDGVNVESLTTLVVDLGAAPGQ